MFKKIVLIISGGIAAYKSLELIRLLKKDGCEVKCVATDSALEFVTAATIEHLSGESLRTSLHDRDEEVKMSHIELARWPDIVLVAPATANIISSMAHGLAGDLAQTLLVATTKQVYVAPSMNVRMWENSIIQRNLELLKDFGVQVIEPTEGEMACGEYGFGRMAEPSQICDHLKKKKSKVLVNKKILVTSGPTHEQIDEIRFIANRSSGKQGTEIARSLSEVGADVTLVTGPVHIDLPDCCKVIRVETAIQMQDAVFSSGEYDIAIFVAAVGDWRVKNIANKKIKKIADKKAPNLDLIENPDILKNMCSQRRRPELVIGFAAETENVIENAKEKLKKKGCDWVCANKVSKDTKHMGGDTNEVFLIKEEEILHYKKSDKRVVAKMIKDEIIKRFSK